MKFIIPTIVLGAALANAQSQCNSVTSSIPACGTSCIYAAGSAVGCATTDYSCLCASALGASSVLASAQGCVIAACGAQAIGVLNGANAVCSCATANAGAVSSSSSAAPVSTSSSTPASTTASSASSAASPASSTVVVSSPTTTKSVVGVDTSVGSASRTSTSTVSAIITTPVGSSSASSASASQTSASMVTANGAGVIQPWVVGGSVFAVFGGLLAVL